MNFFKKCVLFVLLIGIFVPVMGLIDFSLDHFASVWSTDRFNAVCLIVISFMLSWIVVFDNN